MKLHYNTSVFDQFLETSSSSKTLPFQQVAYDTRKIIDGNGVLFVALKTDKNDGHNYIQQAINKGVEIFLVSKSCSFAFSDDHAVLYSENTLLTLQHLAKFHRNQFLLPVVGITGSNGKTTLKEWLFEVLSGQFDVVRSPKSYNSQLGVALSLLEINSSSQIALIEMGVSKVGEMDQLMEMVQPSHAVLTHFGTAHQSEFGSVQNHLSEKTKIFNNAIACFVPKSLKPVLGKMPGLNFCEPIKLLNSPNYFHDLLGLTYEICVALGINKTVIKNEINRLKPVALRMEIFEGNHGNLIVNDTYHLNNQFDSNLIQDSLVHLKSLDSSKTPRFILGTTNEKLALEIKKLCDSLHVKLFWIKSAMELIDWNSFQNESILVKSERQFHWEKQIIKAKKIKHRTFIEIHLDAIAHNLDVFKRKFAKGKKILCMVKASGYGAGAERVSQFLVNQGVDYFGVAFVDEGIALRKAGITLPILVMNPDPEHGDEIIKYNLEPALYDFNQMDQFIVNCIQAGIENYPVHLKFDTGMHRLGFSTFEKEKVLNIIKAQPELRIAGIYSHLADADNDNSALFTEKQIQIFKQINAFFQTHIPYTFLSHLSNSESAIRQTENPFDMVRLGIALYGYCANDALKKLLQESISWYTSVSQVKQVKVGESIGYGCSFTAQKDMLVATLPVGYADGFRRNLSNGKGCVFIQNRACQVLGRVCMDMVMVDVTGMAVQVNDVVEIIGKNQTMTEFADVLETIPYEVMTGFSARMQRLYTQ